MGRGIAMVCAQHGFKTILFDVNETVLNSAREQLTRDINHLTDKQKISSIESGCDARHGRRTGDIRRRSGFRFDLIVFHRRDAEAERNRFQTLRLRVSAVNIN